MAENISEFGSDDWIPSLRQLCFDFLENLQKHPGARFLHFSEELVGTKENPGIIVEEYHKTAEALKLEIYDSSAQHSLIDRHKIAALYIRSILIYKPFTLDILAATKEGDLSLYTMLANEYFSIVYLNTIFKAGTSEFDKSLQIDRKYQFDFIKLMYRYKQDINRLDPLALANIIYLIEQHYFKHSKGNPA